jgi:hypothetical protein
MEKNVLKARLLWSSIVILIAVLGIAAFPCLAEEPINLQQLLFDGQSIQVDNLRFENFTPGPNTLHDASDYENISVQKVGAGTLNPGLKFIPDPDSSPPIWSPKEPGRTKRLVFSYEVNTVDPSSLITGSSLTLYPGILESSSGTASATVQDGKLEVKRELYWLPLGGPQAVSERLEDITTFSGQATVSPNIIVALYIKNEGDQASIEAFEQRLSIDPADGRPVANAGPDQAVFDQVSLDGSGSSPTDAKYKWELYRKDGDDLVPFGPPQPGVQTTFSSLENGFYEAKLTLTNSEEVSAVDTAIIAAAGPSGVGTDPGIQENAELNLWSFKLKKYKYCNWSIARMLGTFDLPDDFEFNRGDDLVGKVTIQVNRGEEPLVVMSDDIKLKVRKWKYKSEIRSY